MSGKYQHATDRMAASGDPEILYWRSLRHRGQPTAQDREQLARWLQEKNSPPTQSSP